MLTYKERIDLRQQLIDGEISIESAEEIYWKDYQEGKRSWHTKDWKDRRRKIIKDKCEICSSTKLLTIQHLSHPKKYSEYVREVTRKYTQIVIESDSTIDDFEFKEYIIKNYDYTPVPLCPNCRERRPNKRVKKLPKFLCVVCRHEFDVPIYKTLDEIIEFFNNEKESLYVRDKCFVSKNNWRDTNSLSNIKYWMQRAITKEKYGNIIRKEAFLLYLDDDIKYLSFENTITACRRCASSYDLNYLDLCPKCKLYYKGIQYEKCIHCLPEEMRESVLKRIELQNEWDSFHENLGID